MKAYFLKSSKENLFFNHTKIYMYFFQNIDKDQSCTARLSVVMRNVLCKCLYVEYWIFIQVIGESLHFPETSIIYLNCFISQKQDTATEVRTERVAEDASSKTGVYMQKKWLLSMDLGQLLYRILNESCMILLPWEYHWVSIQKHAVLHEIFYLTSFVIIYCQEY